MTCHFGRVLEDDIPVNGEPLLALQDQRDDRAAERSERSMLPVSDAATGDTWGNQELTSV